jgi:hypothetical protein
MEQVFRLFDFNVYNENRINENSSESENGKKVNKDTSQFVIQMFGLDESGKTCSILIDDFKPFFYIKVGDSWSTGKKNAFLLHIKGKIGKFYENSITDCKIIKRKKLYGFDNGKEYKFVKFKRQKMY